MIMCGNCGYRLKQATVKQPVSRRETVTPSSNPKVSSNHRKSNPWLVVFGIIVGLLIVGGGGYWAFNHFYGVNNSNATMSSSQSQTSNTVSSSQASISQENNQSSKYNNEEWMLMGYLAYKNKSIGSVDNTVDTISDDFSKGDLRARKNSDDSYTLSNQYGSVDVQVNKDDVVVTNDGTTRTSKTDLEKMFSGKMNKISAMIKQID